VAAAESLDCGNDRFDLVKVRHRSAEHLHQLLLLLRQIIGKQRPHVRRDREQPVIEEIGGRVGDGRDSAKLS
jgi:hypothetical protein